MSEASPETNPLPAPEPTGLAEMAVKSQPQVAVQPPVAAPVAAPVQEVAAPVVEAKPPVDPDPPVSQSTEPIKITEIFAPRPMLTAQQRNDEIMEEIARNRAANAPVNIVKQPVAPQITEQTKREMEAGARAVAKAKAIQDNRPPRVISQKEALANGQVSQVFRPNTVPGMNSKTDEQRGVRNL